MRSMSNLSVVVDFTAVTILEDFNHDSAQISMERVLKMISEVKAKEMIKVIRKKMQLFITLCCRKSRLPSSTFVIAYLDSFHPGK